MNPDDVELIERTVRLRISRDTCGLWEAMAARMGLTLDELAQALVCFWLLHMPPARTQDDPFHGAPVESKLASDPARAIDVWDIAGA